MERASPSQSATEKGEEHRGREKGWSSQLTESRAFCGFTPRSHHRGLNPRQQLVVTRVGHSYQKPVCLFSNAFVKPHLQEILNVRS